MDEFSSDIVIQFASNRFMLFNSCRSRLMNIKDTKEKIMNILRHDHISRYYYINESLLVTDIVH